MSPTSPLGPAFISPGLRGSPQGNTSQASTFLDGIAVGVIALDARLAVGHFNLAATRWFKLDVRSLGQPIFDIPHSLQGVGWRDTVTQALLAGQRREVETEVASGGTLRLSISPIAGSGGATITLEDRSQLHFTEWALRESQKRYRMMANAIADAFWIYSPDAREVVYASPSCKRMYGLSLPSLYADRSVWLTAVHHDDRKRVEAAMTALASGEPCEVEFRIERSEGQIHWLRWRGRPICGIGGNIQHLIGVAEDITPRKSIEVLRHQHEQRLSQIIDLVPHVIFTTDAQGAIQEANAAAAQWAGMSKAQLRGQCMSVMIRDPHQAAILIDNGRELIASGGEVQLGDFPNISPSGELRITDLTQIPLISEDDLPPLTLTFWQDVTERRRSEEALRRRAFYDPLTGLANRDLFVNRLQHALQSNDRPGAGRCAVLFLDLDHFKDINDTRGHIAGDEVLLQTAERLQRCVRPGDTVARFGGDEFAILLNDVPAYAAATAVADRIHGEMERTFVVDVEQHVCTTSIGIAFADDSGDTVHEVLRDADVAMYHAKSRGPANTSIFNQEMRLRAQSVTRTKRHLRGALGQGLIAPHYQAVVELKTGKLCGFEALARWKKGSPGYSTPDLFIPVAEQSGLIAEVERAIWVQVMRDMCQWRENHDIGGLRLSINASPVHLAQGGFAAAFLQLLSEHDIAPEQIILELTETALINKPNSTREALMTLRNAGVGLALDDFGTGYSSLSHLCRFPMNILKIDRSFITPVSLRSEQAHIVEATLSLAKALSMKVTAEGIEAESQLDFLIQHDCAYGQGYYFSKPVTAEHASALIGAQHLPITQALLPQGNQATHEASTALPDQGT